MSARDALPIVTDADTRVALLAGERLLLDRAEYLRIRADAARGLVPHVAAGLDMDAAQCERQAALLRGEFERHVSAAAQAWRDAA